MDRLTIWEAIEDFDNAELDYESWKEQLEEAVMNYNAEYNTTYDPVKTVQQYIHRQKETDQ